MDNIQKKFFLYTALVIISMLLVERWNQYLMTHNPRKTENKIIHTSPNNPMEQATAFETSEPLPEITKTFYLQNSKLKIGFNQTGSSIIDALLLDYPAELNKKAPKQLFNLDSTSFYYGQSGFVDNKKQIEDINYTLERQTEEMATLVGRLGNLTITKTISLKPNSYVLVYDYNIKNNGDAVWNGRAYQQLSQKQTQKQTASFFHAMTTYEGVAISDPNGKHYEKIPYKTLDKEHLTRSITGGWLALQQHYFLSAWILDSNKSFAYYGSKNEENSYTIGAMSEPLNISPRASVNYQTKLYIGPELLNELKDAAPGLELTIDFGWLWIFAQAILWMLVFIHKYVGNWGWSIIFVTFIIKLLFYRLSAKSYHSMANMKKLQPKIEALKKRFGDDREQLGKATMELYQKEKINPFSGCLPMLVQIPIFISLYYVLLESIQLRHADFALWIHDLSIPDPFFVLPVLMGLTMLAQQKLSPPPPDPMQAKMMMIFPVMFCLIGLNFSAGLALYMLTNSCLSILQQWYITRNYEHSNRTRA